MEKKTVFSGIRPTGSLHLGNYLGAIKGMLQLQDKYDCIFSIVDYHAITTPYDPTQMQKNIFEVATDYLAAGLDPKKARIMVQSHVPEHVELAYLLGTVFPVSRLEDLPTYKDKKTQHPDYVNMGLLYYPVLMAADIMIYKGELVPVGVDQLPHLEITREIARKFNNMFGQTFPEPQRFATEGEYVPSLLGEGKMSKSIEGSYIALSDSDDMIQKKIMSAVTDTGPQGKNKEMSENVKNLFILLKLFTTPNIVSKFETEYKEGTIHYSDLKKELAQAIIKELKPFKEKRQYYLSNPDLVQQILKSSAEKCRQQAQVTIHEVKEKMGLLPGI